MTLPGGPADKLGNRYEKWWTLSEFVRMLRGDTDAIRIEDPGVEKAEFVVEVGSQRELHQTKRSHPNGKWSLAELQRDGLLEAIGAQLTDNDDRFVFASGSDAPELSELCAGARDAESVDEFEQRFLEAKARKRSFGAVCGAWACDAATAVGCLRRIHVRTIGEHDLEEKVRWGVQARFLAQTTEVVEALRGIAEDSVHGTLRRQELVDTLARRGYRLRRLTDPAAAGDAVRAATDRFLDPARRRLIQGRLLPRAAVKKLLSRLGESATDTVLTGGAGSGKTACVVGVVDALREGDVPALAFRLDRFVEASTTADLGRRLDLEESPTLVLAEAAKAAGKPGVLIVDQLDAVSAVSGRAGAFELVEQLINEARDAQPRPIHVVVVCREFDWKNDSRLRRLLLDSAMQLDVKELATAEVEELLGDAGFRPEDFKGRQLQILALPQNLSLFLEADFDPEATPTFATATEIFARYWDAKREAVEQRSPDAGDHWMAVVKRLCQEMNDSQQLSVPREHLDGCPARFVGLMASEGVISVDGRRCGFGHESFFDYVFARVFITRREPITAFLKASEQHLFRRAQVRQVLAYLRDRDRVWPVLFKTEPFGLMDGCLWGLADSLATLGRNRIGDLREVIDELRRRDTYTANHLLLGLYRDAAATVADEAVMTLCDEPWRFECGFSDSPRWSATEVLRAVTPRCTSANRGRLENAILNYVPPFERSAGGYKDRGRACFTLLSAIPGELRSDTANARVRELARKFGEPEGAPRAIRFEVIESPITNGATERMTDEQWLRAVAKYPSGDRSVSPEGIRGGARQLADRLEVRTRDDPERFARLALRLPADSNPVYLEAVLNGLRTTAVAKELKLDVCRKAFAESSEPCGMSIVDVLRNLDGEPLEEATQILEKLATEHEDPTMESWQEDAGGQPYYSGAPLEAGINSTRGRAAEAVAELIGRNAACVDRFKETVARMIVDRSAAVRACAAGAVEAIARHRPAQGMSLFLRMDLREDRLLTTPYVYGLLNWSLRDRFAESRPSVERMLGSPEPAVREAGGRLAGLAGLLHDDAADLVSDALGGDAAQRVGIAQVTAANIARADAREWCEWKLARLFDDADGDVRRAAAACFRELSDAPLDSYDDLITAFCASRAVSDASFWLLVTLGESRRRLPGATCMVCEALLRRARDEGADGTGLHTVVELVFRMYRQHQDDPWPPRVLDLLDLLCLEGVMGTTDEFERFER